MHRVMTTEIRNAPVPGPFSLAGRTFQHLLSNLMVIARPPAPAVNPAVSGCHNHILLFSPRRGREIGTNYFL